MNVLVNIVLISTIHEFLHRTPCMKEEKEKEVKKRTTEAKVKANAKKRKAKKGKIYLLLCH